MLQLSHIYCLLLLSSEHYSLLKDLYEHITPHYAADWKIIGTLLGLPSRELKAIEAGSPTNVKWYCNQMLKKWIEMDNCASCVNCSQSLNHLQCPAALPVKVSNNYICIYECVIVYYITFTN